MASSGDGAMAVSAIDVKRTVCYTYDYKRSAERSHADENMEENHACTGARGF